MNDTLPLKIYKFFFISIFILTFFSPFLVIIGEFVDWESINTPWDYAKITDVDYKAELVDEPGSSGKLLVTERLKFDIRAASRDNLFWELWRDLCEDNVDGLKVDYKVNSVKQILENNEEIIFTESSRLYWEDEDYLSSSISAGFGPGKWFHSPGPYNEYRRQYECVFFYVDGLYREQPVYEIQYEMNNAALRYGDCSELYIPMFSEDSVYHLNSFKAQILIPQKDMPKAGNYYANTFGTNTNDFEFTESTTQNPGYHTFSFNLDKSDLKFRPYNEFIEFDLVSFGDDKHIFTEHAPTNLYSNEPVLQELKDEQTEYETEPFEFAKTKFMLLILCLISSFILVKRFLRTDDELESKYNIYTPTMDMDYFRDIPSDLDPLFAANLAFCRHNIKDATKDGYSALLLSLARKKYVELEKINESKDWTNSNTKVIIKDAQVVKLHPDLRFVQADISAFEADMQDDREPLSKNEELYFNLLKRHAINSEISMAQFQSKVSSDYDNTDSFLRSIERAITDIGVIGGYYQKVNYRETEKKLNAKSKLYKTLAIIILLVNLLTYQTKLDLAFGAFFVLSATFLFGSFIYKYLSKKYLLLTQFGEDEYVKWKGLYNFLNSETLLKERTVVELPLWEKYLVYATAFGISEKVIKALKIRCPDIDTKTQSTILSNSYYRSHSFRSYGRSFRSSVRSASSISRSGGYSGYGGGRGGGGGGGGH